MNSYTVGKELISPAAIDMCTKMISNKDANQLKNIPLSETAISRRISLISHDLKVQHSSRMSTGVVFSLQFDESTDIANDAILLCYARYFYENCYTESTTTGRNIVV